ncbi:uncharacterized protein LOC119688420 [Teleopsis dalmanni]|uniref:uncharacterized protein LOC119688420 n=1 Tax=Teleopsis dalmanni TaxID=139649 RepID=UPI0018CE29F7|nr:uncharacterized protein LOC119688420 [Teleopsis dalmanni]
MDLFFNNQCNYNGCGEKFGSLAELIQHVERVHIVMDDSKEVSGSESMVPKIKILPSNVHDVIMRSPVHRINHGSRRHPSVSPLNNINCERPIQMMNATGAASSLQSMLANADSGTRASAPTTFVNQSNCEPPIQLLSGIGSDGSASSLQFVLAPTIVISSANAPFQVPMAFPKSNNCVPPSQSAVAQAKRGAIPKARIQSMGLGGNRDAESFEKDNIPSSSSAVKRKNNSSKISFSKKRISSINRNVEPSMAKSNDVPTQPTSISSPPKLNESTHIALSGLTPKDIVQNSVLRADHSQLKPFPCPIRGCIKRQFMDDNRQWMIALLRCLIEENSNEVINVPEPNSEKCQF